MGEVPFIGVNKADFLKMAPANGTVIRFAAGSDVFRARDSPDYMYIILSGTIEVRGHDKPIEKISVGDSLGIVACLTISRGQPRLMWSKTSNSR